MSNPMDQINWHGLCEPSDICHATIVTSLVAYNGGISQDRKCDRRGPTVSEVLGGTQDETVVVSRVCEARVDQLVIGPGLIVVLRYSRPRRSRAGRGRHRTDARRPCLGETPGHDDRAW